MEQPVQRKFPPFLLLVGVSSFFVRVDCSVSLSGLANLSRFLLREGHVVVRALESAASRLHCFLVHIFVAAMQIRTQIHE